MTGFVVKSHNNSLLSNERPRLYKTIGQLKIHSFKSYSGATSLSNTEYESSNNYRDGKPAILWLENLN